MEFASVILSSILSKVAEYLVKPTLRQARYFFCFKSIVEDLKKEDENLRLALEHVQQQVDTARRNTEEIERDVHNWLMKASTMVAVVQSLKEEINANESRVNGWCSNWGCKYKLSRRAAKKTSILLKLRDAAEFNNISHPAMLPGIEFLAPKDFMTFESTKFAFNRIIKALKDDETSIVGLYGMGGVGKTTLAKAVGNAIKEQKIFDEVIMVVVSHDVDIMRIQDHIADTLSLKLEEKHEPERAKRLFLRLKSEDKILLILDDVWTKLDLRTIGIPFGNEHIGCKILITTRVERVCIAMECQKKVLLNVLNQKEGMDLFKKHTRVGDDYTMLSDVAEKVLIECNGLPLAIVTIGSVLRDKSVEEWEVMFKKLKNSKLDDVEGVDIDVYVCLKLSYDYLKSEETKFCFLLCSLFPEDYEIDLEELLNFGLGLDLFQDADSVEDARSQLRVRINSLKDSCLLLDAGEGHVKMHDLVRDVALWIASRGENVFMVKTGMRLAKWPQQKDIEQCTAISLMRSKIEVFPNQLVCPNVKILLLDGDIDASNEFFEAMKALEVARLKGFHLSLNSLQSLTKLVTLRLINCKLRDMSSLKMLGKLEVLILYGCELDELSEELRELNKLRMLSIRRCLVLKRISINVIPSLSRLEELYIDNSFEAWKAERIRAEGSATSHFELGKLHLQEVEYIIDMTQQYMSSTAFSNLVHLSLHRVHLREICNGGRPLRGFLENLKTLPVHDCDRMSCLFPTSLIQRLRKLKEVTLYQCDELQDVFQLEGLCSFKENPSLLSSLACLDLSNLPNLRNIWKGPTQHVSLQSLTVVEVARCNRLRYVFTLNLARNLLHLQQLKVSDCNSLKHIVKIKVEKTKDNMVAGGGNDVLLPNLRILELDGLENLINFCSSNYSSTWPVLQELRLQWTPSLVANGLGANMQTVRETFRVLVMYGNGELCKGVLAQLKNNFENLEELRIGHCRGVEVIFQLGQQFSLSSLKQLELLLVEELECLYRGPAHLLSLPNLQHLYVRWCPRLRHVLSSSLARNLLQLKTILIWKCGELEQVMVEDDREDHVQLPLFPNLSSIRVRGCDKIKTLFPVNIARLDLRQLTFLRALYSPELEEIFGQKDEADMTAETELVLPQLKRLKLFGLQSLVNFCPRGYHLIFPSLSELWVSGCPKITTRFSVDENGAVHAQAEAPHTHNQHVVDLHCRGSDELRRGLPRYIGK